MDFRRRACKGRAFLSRSAANVTVETLSGRYPRLVAGVTCCLILSEEGRVMGCLGVEERGGDETCLQLHWVLFAYQRHVSNFSPSSWKNTQHPVSPSEGSRLMTSAASLFHVSFGTHRCQVRRSRSVAPSPQSRQSTASQKPKILVCAIQRFMSFRATSRFRALL